MKHQLRYLIIVLFVALTTLCAANAFGAESGAQGGILGGPSVPDAENTHQYLISGIKGSAFIAPSITAGGYYLVSNSGTQAAADGFRYSIHGIQVAYAMPSGSGETFFGVRAGITKVRTSPTGATAEVVFSPYHYGVVAGHDYLLREWLLIGFEGSYLHAETGRATQGGVVYNRDSFNLINFLLSIQVRL